MASKFVVNFFGGSTVVRVVRPNLINWEKKRQNTCSFQFTQTYFGYLGKILLVHPIPRPLLDGPRSVDIRMLAMSSFSIKDNNISLVSGA